jgi:hypothetical protein
MTKASTHAYGIPGLPYKDKRRKTTWYIKGPHFNFAGYLCTLMLKYKIQPEQLSHGVQIDSGYAGSIRRGEKIPSRQIMRAIIEYMELTEYEGAKLMSLAGYCPKDYDIEFAEVIAVIAADWDAYRRLILGNRLTAAPEPATI